MHAALSTCAKALASTNVAETADKLKRPPTAFALFLKAQSSNIRRQYPQFKQTEVMQRASNLWRNQNAALKRPYLEEAQRQLGAYRQQKEKTQLPKKPSSPFVRWFSDNMAVIKSRYPNASITERAQIAGRMWKQVSPVVQQRYKESYMKDLKAFNDNMTDEVKERFQVRKNHLKQKREKEERPARRTANAFTIYVKEYGPLAPEELDFKGNVIKYCSNKWQKMSEAEKNVYAKKAKMMNEQYQKDMKEWRERGGR